MKITIESTTRIVTINGAPARVWEGTSENDIPVIAVIARISVRDDQDTSQFERELRECRPPSPDAVRAFDARLIL
jgi:hypothetical protein